jgi:hypothetical protein
MVAYIETLQHRAAKLTGQQVGVLTTRQETCSRDARIYLPAGNCRGSFFRRRNPCLGVPVEWNPYGTLRIAHSHRPSHEESSTVQ